MLTTKPRPGAVLFSAGALAAALAALNVWIALDFCRAGYTHNMQSNEGAFLAMARVFAGRGSRGLFFWWPWWNAGMPSETVYAPLLPAASAFVERALHPGFVHAYHWVAGLAYSASAAAVFLFAWVLTGSRGRALAAALLWSLVSPTALLAPVVRAQIGGPWLSLRLNSMIYYGEAPHVTSLAFLPLAAAALQLAFRRKRRIYFVAAGVFAAATALTNAFGAASVALVVLALVFAQPAGTRRFASLSTLVFAPALYAAVSPWLPPSLLSLIAHNSMNIGRAYRFGIATPAAYFAGLLLLAFVLARATAPERTDVRFAALFAYLSGAIALPSLWFGYDLIFQAHRYQHELDLGICLLAASAAPVFLPRRRVLAGAALIALLVAVALQSAQLHRQAAQLAGPVDIARIIEYRVASFFGRQFPHTRVMASGSCSLWLNTFTDVPQLSGGHDPTAPNWMQRVAVYTIYTGTNAGSRDAAISVLWLKAFGAHAISVHGPCSSEVYKPFVHPDKFEGVLPVLWRDGCDTIYAVPQRGLNLSHIVPASALVARVPVHGLDVDQVERYVVALENPSLPLTGEAVLDPGHVRIQATIPEGQVLSVQMNYNPGWHAAVNGVTEAVTHDALGLLVVKPSCPRGCTIDLTFDGGPEHKAACVASAVAVGAAVLWLLAGAIRPIM